MKINNLKKVIEYPEILKGVSDKEAFKRVN